MDQAEMLAQRYGGAAPAAGGPWNEVLELMLGHRSVRAYSDRDLPPGTVEMLVAAAQSAATSSNMQSWSVVVVKDAARRARLAKIAANQAHIVQCPTLLMFVADLSRNVRLAERHGQHLDNVAYLETLLTAAIDCGIAGQNTVLAAESLGLHTVYLGAMRNDVVAVARELALPPLAVAMFGLCVGYAAPGGESAVRPRLPQAVTLHHEQYDPAAEAAAMPGYDAAMQGFSRRNEPVPYSFAERVQSRLGRKESLAGRDLLAGALRALGFELR